MNPWEERQARRAERERARWERRQQRMDNLRGPYTTANPMGPAIFGLILIAAGLLFLLRNLGVVYFDNIWDYWPVVLIAIGVSKMVGTQGVHQVTSGLIMAGIGTVFLLRNLDIIHGNIWGYIWPGVFIAVGVSLLLRNMNGSEWDWAPGINATFTNANKIVADTIFGGMERKCVSQAFEGGRISVVFGGANIDLREAAIQQPEVTMSADAVFGGIEIRVPDTWLIDTRGSGVFGSFQDLTHHPAAPATGQPPKLIVKGGAVFGGVTVRN